MSDKTAFLSSTARDLTAYRVDGGGTGKTA